MQLPSSQSCAAHHRLSPKLLFLQLSSFSPYESIPARACSFCSFVFLVPLAQAQVETLYTLLSTSLPIQIIQYISPSLSLSFSPPFFDFISSFSFCVRFRSPVFLCESSLPSLFFFPPAADVVLTQFHVCQRGINRKRKRRPP